MEHKSIVHFIVSLPPFENDLKYRRHRLAEFLLNQESTKKIVWIYPTSTISKQDLAAFVKTLLFGKKETLNNNIVEVGVPDPLPSLTRFSSLVHKYSICNNKEIRDKYASEKKVLWFTYPAYSDLANLKIWDAVVYDCSDYWSNSMNKGLLSNFFVKMLTRSENDILENSNLLFATSEFLKEKIESKTNSKVYLIENGIEFKKFKRAKEGKKLKNISHPRLGYVGGLKPKIKFSLLQEMAHKHPDWNIILIGPKPKFNLKDLHNLVDRYDNVHWIKGVETDIVPEYMKELDVGLLPYKQMDYNKAVFPLKFFEYLGCGLPTVGCGLPSTKKYEKKDVYLYTKGNDESFIEACEKAILWNKNEESRNMRVEIAKNADWDQKFKFMLSKVEEIIESNN